jgi:hypothetical protein
MSVEFFDLDTDTHSEFVRKYNAGELTLTVNTNAAGYLFQNVLAEYAGRQATLRTIFFGGIIGGTIAIFFVGWWSLIGFVVGFIGMKSSRAHTDRSVIQETIKNPDFYRAMVEANILAYRA